MRFDLAIAYRVYPGIAKAPAIYPNDKGRLAEFSLLSLGRALEGLRVKVFALLDACGDEYAAMVHRALAGASVEIIRLEREGNARTFGRQVRTLCDQTDAELVYFAEDDYFYFPGAMRAALSFITGSPEVHFVSLFDHPDLYTTRLQTGDVDVRAHGGHHWRTGYSTCLTFLTSRKVLRATRDTFLTYEQGNHDASMWFALTKPPALRPLNAAAIALREPQHRSLVPRAWRRSTSQILTGQRYRLWSPMPTLATHLESTCMAPGFDWERLLAAAAEGRSVSAAADPSRH